jgi:hypothetical protein
MGAKAGENSQSPRPDPTARHLAVPVVVLVLVMAGCVKPESPSTSSPSSLASQLEKVDAESLSKRLQGQGPMQIGTNLLELGPGGSWTLAQANLWFEGRIVINNANLTLDSSVLRLDALWLRSTEAGRANFVGQNSTLLPEAAISVDQDSRFVLTRSIVKAWGHSFSWMGMIADFVPLTGPTGPEGGLVATDSDIAGLNSASIKLLRAERLKIQGGSITLFLRDSTPKLAGLHLDVDELRVVPDVHRAGESFKQPIPPTQVIKSLLGSIRMLRIEPQSEHHVIIDLPNIHNATEISTSGWLEVLGDRSRLPEPDCGECHLMGAIIWGEAFAARCQSASTYRNSSGTGHMLNITFDNGPPFGPYGAYDVNLTASIGATNITLTESRGTFLEPYFQIPILDRICLAPGQPAQSVDAYTLHLALDNDFRGCAKVDPKATTVKVTVLPPVSGAPGLRPIECEALKALPSTS